MCHQSILTWTVVWKYLICEKAQVAQWVR